VTSDPNLANNEDCDTNQIVALADMEVTKVIDNKDCVVAGSPDSRSYTVTVQNNGPSLAQNVVLFDRFPTDLTVVAFPSSVCTRSGSNFTCSLGNFLPGQRQTLVWTFTVPPSRLPGLVENFVGVSSTTPDPELCNNNATVCSIICAKSDLSVTKTDGVVQVTAGEDVTRTYTIVGFNAGPSDAVNVSFVDTWPAGFTRGTINATGATVTTNSEGFVVTIPSLTVGSSYQFTVTYRVPACLENCQVCNVVVIASPYEDPNETNNEALDCNAVRTEANLEVCKTDSQEYVTAGDGRMYQYTIEVANIGPSCAQKVRLVDHFPQAVIQVAGTLETTQGICINVNGSDFSCNLLTLQPGQVVTIKVNYTVPSSANTCSITNVVTVSSVTFDPELCNNDAKDTTALRENAVLSITKTDNVATIQSTDIRPYTYTITVGNNGPSTARDVTVSDRWPAGFVQFANSLIISKGRCMPTPAGDFMCSIGDLAVGEQVTVRVSYNLMQPAMCGITNNTVNTFSPTDTECRTAVDSTNVLCAKREEIRAVPVIQAKEAVASDIEVTLPKASPAYVAPVPKGKVLSAKFVHIEAKKAEKAVEITVKNQFAKAVVVDTLSVQVVLKSGKTVTVDLNEPSEFVQSTTCASVQGKNLHKDWSASCKIALAKEKEIQSAKILVRGTQTVSGGYHPIMGSAAL
jgi:uncharacterized repeat protein (TIGR01451 family)